MQTRNDRTRAHGREHGAAAACAPATSASCSTATPARRGARRRRARPARRRSTTSSRSSTAPRTAWVMVPAGDADRADGRRARRAPRARATSSSTAATRSSRTTCAARRRWRASGIDYIDVGTSGGVWGLERGYCLMIGGDRRGVRAARARSSRRSRRAAATIAAHAGTRRRAHGTAEEGYLHCGPAGAGHFVKMIHNGIEYGLMQAYAEGFDILRGARAREAAAPTSATTSTSPSIAELWRRGSVVGSWLLDLTRGGAGARPRPRRLHAASSQDSGEGRWTIDGRRSRRRCRPTCWRRRSSRASARARSTRSREKLLSAMREQFGGHVETPKPGPPSPRPSPIAPWPELVATALGREEDDVRIERWPSKGSRVGRCRGPRPRSAACRSAAPRRSRGRPPWPRRRRPRAPPTARRSAPSPVFARRMSKQHKAAAKALRSSRYAAACVTPSLTAVAFTAAGTMLPVDLRPRKTLSSRTAKGCTSPGREGSIRSMSRSSRPGGPGCSIRTITWAWKAVLKPVYRCISIRCSASSLTRWLGASCHARPGGN